MDIRFIRMKELQGIVGLSRTEIYKRAKDGRFPSAYSFPEMPRAKFWSSEEIRNWQLETIKRAKESLRNSESILA